MPSIHPPALPDLLLSGTPCPRTIGSLWEESGAEPTSPDERKLLSLVLPPWQRLPVWEVWRQRAFIEGIFLGFPAGAIVTVEPDWSTGEDGKPTVKRGSNWLIDGQQRVTAIRDFYEGRLRIFDGLSYGDLSRPDQLRRFDRVVLTRIVLPSGTDETVVKNLYMRMAYGGVAHTQQDMDRLMA